MKGRKIMSDKIKLGFALCGSYCTFEKVLTEMERLAEKYEIYPIISENVSVTDSRFGKAMDFYKRISEICKREPITSIAAAEPIGPKGFLDVLLIEPCTGNTLAKLANGITDTSVTMAAKAHLRNGKPLVIAVSTNDALGTSAKNIAELLNRKNVFFVPMGQDNPLNKPNSLVADFGKTDEAIIASLEKKQVQPLLI